MAEGKTINVPDEPPPTAQLCWAQSAGMVRCDRKHGHLGRHTWEGLCEWKAQDEGEEPWEASCGITWEFNNGKGPSENHVNYCPSCGRPIKMVIESTVAGPDTA
jgi:hypothetical protein